MELDTLDRKILLELDRNSRIPISRLAKNLKQGRDKVEYRLSRLEEQKIITKYSCAINIYKLGYYIYKTYFRVENNKEKINEFIAYLKKHPQIYWIAKADGSWDILIAVFAKNASRYHEVISDLLSKYNSILLDFRMYTIVDMWVFNKHYLHGKSQSNFTVGGPLGNEELDSIDLHILSKLSLNSRTSNKELAEDLNTSLPTISYRIEQLEKKKIIVAYPIEINYPKLGLLFFKTQLFLRSFDLKLRMEFLDYCFKHPNITFCIRQIGDCLVEIELEVSNYQQYNQIIEEIRQNFSKLIRNFNSMLINETFFNWMPRGMGGVELGKGHF